MLNKFGWILRPVHDVDFLAVKFVHDVAHPLTQWSDA